MLIIAATYNCTAVRIVQELWTSAQSECRPFRDPNFDLRRLELEAAVQAALPTADVATQAKGGLKRTGAVQTQPREGEACPAGPPHPSQLHAAWGSATVPNALALLA